MEDDRTNALQYLGEQRNYCSIVELLQVTGMYDLTLFLAINVRFNLPLSWPGFLPFPINLNFP